MTVAANDTIERYVITGAGPYAYTWRIFNDTDLQVYALSTDSPPTPSQLTYLTHYTVSGANLAAGGTITLTAAALALFTGFTLDIRANTPRDQPTSIRNLARFLPEIHEDAYDYLSRQIQDLSRKVDAKFGYPDNESLSGTVPSAAARKGFYLFWDSITGALTTAVLSATAMTQQIIGQLLNPQTPAEAFVGVVPTNYWIAPYIRGRYNTFTEWRVVCDQAGAEGQLDADYAIAIATRLPTRCDFKGYKITGAFDTVHQAQNSGYVYNWRAKQPVIRGNVFCRYTGINTEFNYPPEDTGVISVDGGVSIGASGTEECDIGILYTRRCTVTNDNGYVNFNVFRGSGKALYMHFTGVNVSNNLHGNLVTDLNVFKNGAGTEWGLVNDCVVQETNYAENIYYEGGADIVGPWHLSFFQADALKFPAISRFNHTFGAVGINPRVSRDFFSLTVNNLAIGGHWDILDGAGKPPCISHSGGASVSVNVDATEPAGVGSRYQADFADAFDQFQIALQPAGSDRFGLMIFYKSTADFVAFESVADAVTTSCEATAVADPGGNNWKILRICGNASKTGVTTVKLYAYAGVGGATKTMSIGGVFGGAERAVISPQRPTTRYRYGSATFDPSSLADGAGQTTTVTVAGVAPGDFIQWSFTNPLQGITVTAYYASANTIEVRFQNESGGVLDLASGTLRVQTQTPYA